MDTWSRILLLLKVKIRSLVSKSANPLDALDAVLEQQKTLLHKTRQKLVNIATIKSSLELKSNQIRTDISTLEDRATRALAGGREDIAILDLRRRQALFNGIGVLECRLSEATEIERKLSTLSTKLADQLEQLTIQRYGISAQQSMTEAFTTLNDVLNQSSSSFHNLSSTLADVEESTKKFTAQVDTIDTLLETSALSRPINSNDFEQQLNEIAIENKLAELKAGIDK